MYGTDPSLLLTTYAYTLTGMFAGYVAAGVLNESGLTNLLIKRLSGSLGRVVHPALAPTLVLYVVSPRSAHAYASSCLRRGLVSPVDVYLVMMVSGLPLRLLYLYRIYIPILIPLLGAVALRYIALRLVLDLSLAAIATAYGFRKYSSMPKSTQSLGDDAVILSTESLLNGVTRGVKDMLKFLPKYSVAYVAASALLITGVINSVAHALAPVLASLGLTSLGLTYVTASIVSPKAAVGIAKLMISSGHSTNEVLGAMFLGNTLFLALNEAWARTVPLYLSTYPRRVAATLTLLKVVVPAAYSALLAVTLLTAK